MMKTRSTAHLKIAVCVLMALVSGLYAASAQGNGTAGYRFSGPYTHKNLTVYLVHGEDRVKGKKFITLQEAMERGMVKVYETGNVNELAVENLSRDKEVFVHSGDIVRGGQQDRTLSYDLILPAKSGRVKIAAFCVEHGRWTKRGNESSREFNSSTKLLTGRELKLAAKYRNEQGEVWKKVSETQDKLANRLGVAVRNDTSSTSMELALNNAKVRSTTDEYVKALADIVKGKNDVIGYVFSINGQVNSADVYGSADLFGKLWPKLLNSCAVEAIADQSDAPATVVPTEQTVRAALDDAAAGTARQNDVNDRVRVVIQETKKNVMFETRDRKEKDEWVHRNYIRLE